MLSLFKKNSFFNSIMMLGYAAVLHLIPTIVSRNEADIFGLSGILASLIHILILFVQAIFINRMIIEHRLHRDIMLFPGVFYILFASLLPSFWNLSHILITNFFILWGIFELFQIYKTPNPATQIFNAAFLVGIASIFCAPAILFLILILIGISNLKKMELVHPLQIIVGGFVPWFLWITYHVWQGTEANIFNSFTNHFSISFLKFDGGVYQNIVFILLALLLVFLFLSYNELRKKKHIQAQKKVDILYLSLIMAIVVMIFHQSVTTSGILFVVPFIGIFIGLMISHIKNTSIAELVHIILFLGVILIQFFTLFKI